MVDGERNTGPVGLVGLGNMGSALAGRLAAQYPLIAYDVRPTDAIRELAAGGAFTLAGSLPEVAAARRIVLSLPAPGISRAVVTELLDVLTPGSVIVETSTVTPMDIAAMREFCEPASVKLLDAAILSGVRQSAEGVATVLIGGDTGDVDSVRDILSTFASTITHLGPAGSGMAAKVINNAVAHATMVMLCEAGAMAAAWSIPRAKLGELFASQEGGLIRPLTHRFMERVLGGDYAGGMPTEAARKDSTLALQLAEHTKIPLFTIQAAHTAYELGMAAGLGRQDYASIATLWEGWTGLPLRDSDSDSDTDGGTGG